MGRLLIVNLTPLQLLPAGLRKPARRAFAPAGLVPAQGYLIGRGVLAHDHHAPTANRVTEVACMFSADDCFLEHSDASDDQLPFCPIVLRPAACLPFRSDRTFLIRLNRNRPLWHSASRPVRAGRHRADPLLEPPAPASPRSAHGREWRRRSSRASRYTVLDDDMLVGKKLIDHRNDRFGGALANPRGISALPFFPFGVLRLSAITHGVFP